MEPLTLYLEIVQGITQEIYYVLKFWRIERVDITAQYFNRFR